MITRVRLNKNSICDNNFIKPKDKFRIVIDNDYYAGILRCSLSSVSTSMEKFDIYNLDDFIKINVIDFVIKGSKIVLSSTDMVFPKIHFLKKEKITPVHTGNKLISSENCIEIARVDSAIEIMNAEDFIINQIEKMFESDSAIKEYLHYKFLAYGI